MTASSEGGGAPRPFRIDATYVLAGRDGAIVPVTKDGPPPRIEGLTIGVHHVSADSPHDGELHLDGDELIVVLAGAVAIELDGDPIQRVHVTAGHGFVVPRLVWHRLLVEVPTTLLHATPGPGFDVRWST